MPDQYLFKLIHSLSAKNSMDRQINEHFIAQDGTLIHSSEDLEVFKNLLKEQIEELHKQNPRCKKIHLSIWSFESPGKTDAFEVTCGCSTAKIYVVKQHFSKP